MTFVRAQPIAAPDPCEGDRPRGVSPGERLGRGERVALLVALGLLFALRTAEVTRIHFDTDEPQHLHVAWAWTQGHVQYRDVFDNHAPLFHLLLSPFVRLIGERADAGVLARFAMFPLFAAALLLTGLIGRRLFGARVGAWAAALLGFHTEFFSTSLEFRTDDLWLVGWLATLWVLVGGRWSNRRALVGGLVLGFTFAVSLKTSLLAACLAAAALLAPAVYPVARRGWTARRVASGALAVAAGALVVPSLVVAGFAAAGAFDALVYCTIRHSVVSLGDGGWRPLEPWIFSGVLLGLVAVAIGFARSRLAPGDRQRQLTVLLCGGLAAAVIFTVWPTSTRQDGLPLLPGAALALAAVLVPACDRAAAALSRRARGRWQPHIATCMLCAVVGLLGARLLVLRPLSHDGTSAHLRDLGQVLALTDPSDYVMDAKGDAIFRERPFYYVLELFTKWRLKEGLIEDRIVERMVETGTAVVFGDLESYTPRARAFVNENYVGSGRLRVAGRLLGDGEAGTVILLPIAVPARYALVAEGGPPEGLLDATPYTGSRDLAAGPHLFVPERPVRRLAVVWAKAADRGFSPFGRAKAVP